MEFRDKGMEGRLAQGNWVDAGRGGSGIDRQCEAQSRMSKWRFGPRAQVVDTTYGRGHPRSWGVFRERVESPGDSDF